ncbi:MAG: dihydrodipicolinate synthase family protein [Chloroflexi bacterium]|nr:dihydrodipicolinate synthase family protein [Chloroflexota bacterium]
MQHNRQTGQNRFKGVVIPMVTPVTPEGNLDEPAVHRLIEYIIDGGVSGIFVLGTTGEAASIPPSMKLRLVEITVQQVAKIVQVYAGISDNCFSNSIQAAQAYLKLGVDVVVAHLPICYELNGIEQEAYYEALSKSVNGPLMIYNIPSTTKMSIPLDVVQRLSKLPNIIGLKDSQNDINRLTQEIELPVDRSNFAFFTGTTALSVDALKLGWDGTVPSLGNLVPGLCQRIYTSVRSGHYDDAMIYQKQLDDLSTLLRDKLSLGQSLAAHKTALSAIGICSPSVLPPLQPLSEAKQLKLIDDFTQWLPTIEAKNDAVVNTEKV